MSVAVNSGSRLDMGTPTPVLSQPYFGGLALLSRAGTYDVSPDGRRFVMLKQAGTDGQTTEPATVVVVKNWVAELRRAVPTPQ